MNLYVLNFEVERIRLYQEKNSMTAMKKNAKCKKNFSLLYLFNNNIMFMLKLLGIKIFPSHRLRKRLLTIVLIFYLHL